MSTGADDRAPREAAWRMMMAMVQFGESLGAAIATRADDASFSHNAPLAVITELALRGPRRPSQLAAFTGLTSGGLTKMVDRLEEGGLVARTVGEVPRDRRAVTVRLTDQGQRMAAIVADAVLEHLSLIRMAHAELTAIIDLVDEGLDTWDGDDALSRHLGRGRPTPPTR